MNRGEIWLISLDPSIGSEIKKTRPVIIVNNNQLGKLPLKVIVPLTEWNDKYINLPWHVKINPDISNNLTKESSADCFQVRSVAEERFLYQIGVISDKELSGISIGLAKVLNIFEF
jgi:mRNA interferase MazF